jgi:DNA-directed RNA polymerase specialized sigma24 family protein
MNWHGIDGQLKQRAERDVRNWGKIMSSPTATIAGKHEQLVETLQEKYSIAPKGKPFDDLFGNKIAKSIESLPSNFRTIVLLGDVEELKYVEIAKILACPIGTVCSRLHRGRKVLQQSLSDNAIGNAAPVRKFNDSENLLKESFK